jgi:hypothetical protein
VTVDAWANFGVAVTGASAALTGLLFVALSINLRQILRNATLSSRALLALLAVVPLFSTMLLLVPQPPRAYGIELLVLGALFGAWLGYLCRPSARPAEQPLAARVAGMVAPVAVVVAGTLAAGALLTAGQPAGIYALAVAVLAAFAGALTSTWVLVVEILR